MEAQGADWAGRSNSLAPSAFRRQIGISNLGVMPTPETKPRPSHARFGDTRWSMVLEAKNGNDAALADLCSAYWYPAYAFVRRSGASAEEAKDLVQAFFADRVLNRAFLAEVDPARGTFRAWFAQSLRHFVINQFQRSNTLKRGGGLDHVPMDPAGWNGAEERYQSGLVDHVTPERLFDRALGVVLVNQALSTLRKEYEGLGKLNLFEVLAPVMVGRGEHGSHSELSAQIGMSEGAIRVALVRLRKRFGQALLDEMLKTVADLKEARIELAALLQAWAEAGSPLDFEIRL